MNTQPLPTVPNVDWGTISVIVPLASSTTCCTLPSEVPAALTQIVGAKPCASSRSLQASAGLIE